MDNLFYTIIAAVILMGIVIAGLGIGLILTGKSKLKKGCGMTPSQDKKGSSKKGNNSSCSICGSKKVCDNESDDDLSRDNHRKSKEQGKGDS